MASSIDTLAGLLQQRPQSNLQELAGLTHNVQMDFGGPMATPAKDRAKAQGQEIGAQMGKAIEAGMQASLANKAADRQKQEVAATQALQQGAGPQGQVMMGPMAGAQLPGAAPQANPQVVQQQYPQAAAAGLVPPAPPMQNFPQSVPQAQFPQPQNAPEFAMGFMNPQLNTPVQ